MKNFKKLLSGSALVVLLSLTLILFSVNSVQAQGNGTIVEVIKGGLWYLDTGCGVYETTKSTDQLKNGNYHLTTVMFKIPKDNCWIEDRAYRFEWEGFRFVVNPSGKIVVTYVDNTKY